MEDDDAKMFWLVWNPMGARPPVMRHCSRAAARDEARRLAASNRGQRFYVLRAETFVEVEPVPVREVELVIECDDDESPF